MRIILALLLCCIMLSGCRSAAEREKSEKELANIKSAVNEFCTNNKTSIQSDIADYMMKNDYDYIVSIKNYSPKKAAMLVWKLGRGRVARAHVVRENDVYKVVKVEIVENDFLFNP